MISSFSFFCGKGGICWYWAKMSPESGFWISFAWNIQSILVLLARPCSSVRTKSRVASANQALAPRSRFLVLACLWLRGSGFWILDSGFWGWIMPTRAAAHRRRKATNKDVKNVSRFWVESGNNQVNTNEPSNNQVDTTDKSTRLWIWISGSSE